MGFFGVDKMLNFGGFIHPKFVSKVPVRNFEYVFNIVIGNFLTFVSNFGTNVPDGQWMFFLLGGGGVE